MWVNVLLFLVALAAVAYFYITRHVGWFKARGIDEVDYIFPYVSQEFKEALTGKLPFVRVTSEIYKKYINKKMVGFPGLLGGERTILIIDQSLIKQMFIKDFDHFTGKQQVDLGNKYLNNALFALEGEKWRQARHASTPVFTSGKLRKMSRLMKKVADELITQLNKFALSGEEVDAKDLSSRFTVTVIANAGFGIDVNAFEPQGEQFYKMAEQLTGKGRTTWDLIKLIVIFSLPKFLSRQFKLDFHDGVKFFNDIIDQRLKMNMETKRNDMVDLFTETMMGNVSEEDKKEAAKDLEGSELTSVKKFTKEEMDTLMRGNLFAMFLAGMELPAIMMSGCIFFLARNQDIQERLFLEIKDANIDENLEYNVIMNLPYLDMVVRETMRHSTFTDGRWKCSKDYQVPGTNVVIPKGMGVTISAYGISMDERFFPNPTEFNPEHFNTENKENRSSTTELVFSIGPRQCIGNRFAMLQLKTGIANMVSKFCIRPAPSLPEKYEPDPKSGTFKIKGGIQVKFEKRETD